MFFLLSKLLPPFVFPPGGNLVLLVTAVLLRKRRPRTAMALFGLAIVSLYALSTPAVFEAVGSALEAKYPPVSVAAVPAADAIVILGGVLHIPAPGRPDVELTESSDRLWMAVRLYRAGKAPLMVVSGSNIPLLGEHGMTEARAARGLLLEWGVPASAMVLEERARNTHENAVFSKALLEARGARRVLLVTSAYHMPRAMAIFRREGIDAFAVPTDYVTGWSQPDPLLCLLPNADSLSGSIMMFHEWLGIWIYRLRGWA